MKTEAVLGLEVCSVDGLLDIGGSPLAGPRLHPDAVHSLAAQAGEFPRAPAFRIEVRVPPAETGRAEEVGKAVRAHFLREHEDAQAEVREISTKGRWSFLVAFFIVAALIFLSEAILKLGEGRFITVISESLVIVAWVALWGPAETLLFNGFPARRRRDLMRTVANARVELVPAGADRR